MPRYGGRQKGTPNKKCLPLQQKALELGIDPFEILLYFAAGDWKKLGYKSEKQKRYGAAFVNEDFTIDPAVRARAAAEACQYMHAKRKAIEYQEVKKRKRPLKELTSEQLTALAKKETK